MPKSTAMEPLDSNSQRFSPFSESGVNRDQGHRPPGWHSPSRHARAEAVRLLAASGDIRSVPLLVEALEDASWEVRLAAAEGLGSFQDSASVEPLLRACRDQEPRVAEAARTALGLPGLPAQVTLADVVRLRKSDSERTRLVAAYCATENSYEVLEHIGALADCAADPELPFAIRRKALDRLAAIPHEEAGEALLRVAKSAPRALCLAALEALRRARKRVEPASLRVLCESADPTVARLAVECAGAACGIRAREIVEWALASRRPELRVGAYIALLHYNRPEFANRVWDAVGDKDSAVRAGFAQSVRWGVPREVSLALASLLDDPVKTVRLSAVEALARVGHVLGWGFLSECVRCPDEEVRRLALRMLEQQGGAVALVRPTLASTASSPYERARTLLRLAQVGGFDPYRVLMSAEADPALHREAVRVRQALQEMKSLLRAPEETALSEALASELLRRPSAELEEEDLLRRALPSWIRSDEELLGQ